MSDTIVKRLNSYANSPGMWCVGQPALARDAAARIEELEDALRTIAACWDSKFVDGDDAAENMKQRALSALSKRPSGEPDPVLADLRSGEDATEGT